MANRLETARDYLISIGKRTLGFNAYQRYVAQPDDLPSASIKKNRRSAGIVWGLMQLAAPVTTDSLAREFSRDQFRIGDLPSFIVHRIIPVTDWVSWMYLAAGTDNFVQFSLYKLAANATTHVGLDLGGEAIKRLKSFRPSADILAV